MSEPWTNWLGLFAEDFSLRVAITLLHFLWQGVAIGALVLLLNRLLRASSATSRYLLHTVALLMLPLCVVMTFAVAEVPSDWRPVTMKELVAAASSDELGREVISLGAVETPLIDVTHGMSGLPANEVEQETGPQVPTAFAQDTQNQDATSEHTEKPQTQPLFPKLAPGFVLIYFFGVGMFLLRFALAMWGGHRLRSASNAIGEPALLRVVANQARKIGLRLVPAVRYCERVSVPVVVGVLRPVILLPASLMTSLAPEQFAAIISHELSHIRRYDLLVNLLQRVIESVLFFHPVVWYLSRRMSAEREICCDDLVVSSGYQPLDYAGALLRMAELYSPGRHSDAVAVAASGDDETQFEFRIRRLMNTNRDSPVCLTRTGVLMIALLIVSIAFAPAIVGSGVKAQDKASREIGKEAVGESNHTQAAVPTRTKADHEATHTHQPSRNPRPQYRSIEQHISPTQPPIWARDNIRNDPFVLPDGRRLLTGNVIRDLNTGNKLGELDLGGQTPHVMKLSANGRFVFISSEVVRPVAGMPGPVDRRIQVFDLSILKKVGEPIRSLPWPFAFHGMQWCVDVSSDGKTVVMVLNDFITRGYGTGVETGGIYSWKMETGQLSVHDYKGSGNQVDAVALSPDGQWLVISDRNKLTYLKWKTKEKPTTISVGRRIVSLAFSPDSRYLAEGPDSRRDIQLRDMQTLKIVRSFKDADESPLYINTDALTFSRDGKRLIAGNAITVDERKLKIPHRIHVWDVESGKVLRQIATPHHQVWSLDVSPDGKRIAARLVDRGQSLVAVWSVNQQEPKLKPLKKQGAQKPNDDEWPPRDRVKFLERLQRRDTEFYNRSLEIERRWVERVDPRGVIAEEQRLRSLKKLPKVAPARGDWIRAPYDQPHLVPYRLTVVGWSVSTIDHADDLETMKHPRYGKAVKAQRWPDGPRIDAWIDSIIEAKFRMTSVKERTRQSFEWSCGYGFARWIVSIDSMRVQNDRLVIKGKSRVFPHGPPPHDNDSSFEIELDRDLIVRRAVITVALKSAGYERLNPDADRIQRFLVKTSGTIHPVNAPPVAAEGRYRLIYKNPGESEHIDHDETIAFVGISRKLTAKELAQPIDHDRKPYIREAGDKTSSKRPAQAVKNARPPANIARRWKPDVAYAVSVRLVSKNGDTEKETTTSWLPFPKTPGKWKHDILFGSTGSAGWYRTQMHWLGEPLADMKREGFGFHSLRTKAPDTQKPGLNQFTNRDEVLWHMSIYSEANCFLNVTSIDDKQVEVSLSYLGLEFPDAFKSRDGKETALYGVISNKPIVRRVRLGEEVSFVVVDDKKRQARKTAYIRVIRHVAGGKVGGEEKPTGVDKKLPASTDQRPRKGLEFLAKYPKLQELSLDMTEKQFLEIVKRQGLKPRRSPDGSTYSIPLPDGLEVLVMFGNNGDKCSGIQRVGIPSRKELSAEERKVLKAAQDAAKQEISAALDLKGNVEFVKTSFIDAMKTIEKKWNISVVIDREALNAVGITVNQQISDVSLSGITRRSMLNLILSNLNPKMTYVIEDGLLKITIKEAAGNKVGDEVPAETLGNDRGKEVLLQSLPAAALLQGEWEYVSNETNGKVSKYTQPMTLLIADGKWTVQPFPNGDLSHSHRVEISGEKLTFHGQIETGPGAADASDVEPAIAYGLYRVTADTLVYCMTSNEAKSSDAATRKKRPQNFKTAGTDNMVYHLRRRVKPEKVAPGTEKEARLQKLKPLDEESLIGTWKSTARYGETLIFGEGHQFEILFPYNIFPHNRFPYSGRCRGKWKLSEKGQVLASYHFTNYKNSPVMWPIELDYVAADTLEIKQDLGKTRYVRQAKPAPRK